MCRFCVGKDKGKSPFGDLQSWGLHALLRANIDTLEKLKAYVASGKSLLHISGLGKGSQKDIFQLLNIKQRKTTKSKRLKLKQGREHLTVTNEFQSDKYPWCPVGFVPIKVTDLMAMDLLSKYAERRKVIDAEFTRDLHEALLTAGYRSVIK